MADLSLSRLLEPGLIEARTSPGPPTTASRGLSRLLEPGLIEAYGRAGIEGGAAGPLPAPGAGPH